MTVELVYATIATRVIYNRVWEQKYFDPIPKVYHLSTCM